MFQDNDLVTLYDIQAGLTLVWNGNTAAPNVILTATPAVAPQWLAQKSFGPGGHLQGFQLMSLAAQQAGVQNCYLDGATLTGTVLMNLPTFSGTFWAPIFRDNTAPDNGTLVLVCLGNQSGSRILFGQDTELRLAMEISNDTFNSTIWLYSRTKRGELQLTNLNIAYQPNGQQLFQSCAFQLVNNGAGPFPRDNQPSSWVSIDGYLTPSQTDISQFVSIGDMPCNVSALAAHSTSPTFNVTNETFLWDLSRFVEMNPNIASQLVGQTCYVYLQMRRSDGTILPVDGCFSAPFTYQGVKP